MKLYKAFLLYFIYFLIVSNSSILMAQDPQQTTQSQDYFKQVDQTVWVIKDLNQVVNNWQQLGFDQVIQLGTVEALVKKSGKKIKLNMAQANLGGAIITWIQPLETKSIFAQFDTSVMSNR